MGVYIKDMEMPSGCASCDFANYLRDGEPYCRRLMRRVPAARRLPDCPLGPVPPHGRLIDADELLQSHSVSDGIYYPDAYIPATAIKAAPTIIPAEEADCHTSDTVTGSR